MPLPSCVSSCSLFVINVLITINHYSVLSFELILKDTHMPGLQISSSLHTLLNVLRKLRRKGKTHTASCNLKAHSVYDPPPNLFPAPTTFQSSKFPSLCFPLSPIFSSCTPGPMNGIKSSMPKDLASLIPASSHSPPLINCQVFSIPPSGFLSHLLPLLHLQHLKVL